MKVTEKLKMCPSCDGHIPFDAAQCPLCGVAIYSEERNNSFNDSLSSLYAPPYSSSSSSSSSSSFDQDAALYSKKESTFEEPKPMIHHYQENEEQTVSTTEEKPSSSGFGALFFLTFSAQLLVIGLLQLFFSDNGVLRLEWSAHYWYYYCLGALPLLFFGVRKYRQLH